jgi:Nif-specific regulatory protein
MVSRIASHDVRAHELQELRRERDLYVRLLRLGDERAIERLLREALWLALDATGARQGYLELSDGDDEPALRPIACGLSEAEVVRVRGALARGELARAVATGVTAITPLRPVETPSGVRPLRPGATLCTAIGHDAPLGVLYLHGPQHRPRFDRDDAAAAELIARHLATLAECLRPVAASDAPAGRGLVGRSAAFRRLLEQTALVAPLDVPVWLIGAPGAGITRIGRALHDASARAGGPFVAVACSELAETREQPFAPGGAASTARRGTLLLEDVDARAADDQAALLELSTAARRGAADVRVIASTAGELRPEVDAGRFREDLYLVLGVMPLRVPSLAERPDDVAPLAGEFLRRAGVGSTAEPLLLSPGALDALERADWPANVRQLAETVARGARRAVADGVRQVERAHLFPQAAGTGGSLQDATRRFQSEVVARVLNDTRGDVAMAARHLGVPESHLATLIRTYQSASRRDD